MQHDLPNSEDLDQPQQAPELLTPDKIPVFAGPFTEHKIIIGGRLIPNLIGSVSPEGHHYLVLHNRFPFGPFSRELAAVVAEAMAQAMAIGAGYDNCLADQPGRPFALAVNVHQMPAANGAAEEQKHE